jgi:hypothetical protein
MCSACCCCTTQALQCSDPTVLLLPAREVQAPGTQAVLLATVLLLLLEATAWQ